MIVYLSTYQNEWFIKEALVKVNNPIISGEVATGKEIDKYLKSFGTGIRSIDTIIIDLQSVDMESQEKLLSILQAYINTYPDIQIIIIDLTRKPKDELLYQIYELGIYDIITNQDAEELFKCITVGKSRKEAVIYHEKEKREGKGLSVFLKNMVKKLKQEEDGVPKDKNVVPIVITSGKEEISQEQLEEEDNAIAEEHEEKKLVLNRRPLMIGFCGSMHRIGTSVYTLAVAASLQKEGFKVAIKENEPRIFSYIKEGYTGVIEKEGYFQYDNIDFIEDDRCYKVEDYDCILFDYGTEIGELETSACEIKILVNGSKAWEFEEFLQLILAEKSISIGEYIYFFSFTAKINEENLRHALQQDLHPDVRLYFPGYIEDMFATTDKENQKLMQAVLEGWCSYE